jgi:hypothetical protein
MLTKIRPGRESPWVGYSSSPLFGHLAWPVVVLIIAFAVRKQLGSLAERVLELSFGGATVKFDKLLSKGAEIIDHAPVVPKLPVQDRGELEPTLEDVQDRVAQHINQLAKIRSHPADITDILVSYENIEKLLREIGEGLGRGSRSTIAIMHYLLTRGLMSADFNRLYETLREGRNVVAHAQAVLSKGEIEEYIRQASFFQVVLEMLLEKVRAGDLKPE